MLNTGLRSQKGCSRVPHSHAVTLAVYLALVIEGCELPRTDTHYLFTPNLELGVQVGGGITDGATKYYSNVGSGWRF